MITFIRLPLAALLVSTSLTAAFAQPMGGPGGMGPSGPTSVGVITMTAEAVPMTTTLPGRIVPSAIADVRPQVGGIITSVSFTEGQQVSAGDVLYTIDAATFEADLAVAEATVRTAEAQIPTATATVERYERLVETGGVAQTELDTARVTLAQAEASLASAEAQLKVAQITLDNATIHAPISGTIGKSTVDVGALVTANQTDALATIRQLDPVEIELSETSANLLALREALGSGTLVGDPSQATVTITLENGIAYDQTGTITSADSVVSESTASFSIRVSMPNPDRTLMPGMFVRATVAIGDQTNAFLVPQRAVTFNADGDATAYFVTDDNKAEQRVLTAARSYENAWVVTAGIANGDELVVDGLQKVTDGGDVAAVPVTIEDNGVIYQEPPRSVASAETAGSGQ